MVARRYVFNDSMIPEHQKLVENLSKLDTWKSDNPELQPGANTDIRDLIQEILDCHDKMVTQFMFPYNDELVDSMIVLLEDQPPDSDPP